MLQHRVNTFSIAPAGTPRKIFQLALNTGVFCEQNVSITLPTRAGRSDFNRSRTTKPPASSFSSGNVKPRDTRVGSTYSDKPAGHMTCANLGSRIPSLLSLSHEAMSSWSRRVIHESPLSPSFTKPSKVSVSL
ncbi:unnamed protein product [Ectocarpus sp. 12 AP-2014]